MCIPVLTQLCYQVEVFNVTTYVPFPWRLNGTVDDDLGRVYVCRRCADISCVKNQNHPHCKSRAMWLLFLWPIIHYDVAIRHIFDSIPRHLLFFYKEHGNSVISTCPPSPCANMTSSLANNYFHVFMFRMLIQLVIAKFLSCVIINNCIVRFGHIVMLCH